MSQHRKHRGYQTQRIVAEYLREWWPYCEPTGAGRPGSDLTGLIGIDTEIKARRDLDLTGLIRQQKQRAAEGVVCIGIVRPDGYGPASVADWPTVMRLEQAVTLLREAGHA